MFQAEGVNIPLLRGIF